MICRFARAEDAAEIVEMARECVAESVPHHAFDEEKLHAAVLASIDAPNPTFFVVEQGDGLIGFLEAYANEYNFTDGFFTVPHVTWVRPAKRGTLAAAQLIGMFLRWSDKLGAKENIGGNSNGFDTERTARFLGRFGYQPVGVCMKRFSGGGP